MLPPAACAWRITFSACERQSRADNSSVTPQMLIVTVTENVLSSETITFPAIFARIFSDQPMYLSEPRSELVSIAGEDVDPDLLALTPVP